MGHKVPSIGVACEYLDNSAPSREVVAPQLTRISTTVVGHEGIPSRAQMDAVHLETGRWRLALADGSEQLGLGQGRTTRSDDPYEIVRQHRGEAGRVGSRDRPILHSDLVGE